MVPILPTLVCLLWWLPNPVDPEAPTVVYLHGISGSANQMRVQTAAYILRKVGYLGGTGRDADAHVRVTTFLALGIPRKTYFYQFLWIFGVFLIKY